MDMQMKSRRQQVLGLMILLSVILLLSTNQPTYQPTNQPLLKLKIVRQPFLDDLCIVAEEPLLSDVGGALQQYCLYLQGRSMHVCLSFRTMCLVQRFVVDQKDPLVLRR